MKTGRARPRPSWTRRRAITRAATRSSCRPRPGVAQALVAADLHGLGAGYVRELPLRLAAVDEAAAKAAAGALLQPDAMLVVIVGKAAAIEPQLADKGIAYEKIGFKDPISAAARAAAKTKKP